MNLNDFVVLAKDKAKSVKLNARNLQNLQMETLTLAQENKEMEEKLQQLKESMSKEKEERGHSGGFRWKSGQCGSLNSTALTNSAKKNKESGFQKQLSAGKVKIRVLKDEPLTAPPQQPPPTPTTDLRKTRKKRLRGAIGGQCEVETAGLICSECTENYCIGCFSKFHQKGALKLHRIIPIQTDLQTPVNIGDVRSYPSTFTNPNPRLNSKPNSNRQGDQSPKKGAENVAKLRQLHHDTSQVLIVNHGEEKKVEMIREGLKRKDDEEFSTPLLRGEYNEEGSARFFQEALRQWREEKSDEAGESLMENAMWIPVRPVSCSAVATQADFPPDRETKGWGRGGQGSIPVMLEFTENSLTYMDRLLLKKHRRTPIEMNDPSMVFGPDLKSLHNTSTEEDSSLTAQEEDLRRYCASLFAVPVKEGRTEAQITTPEPCFIIEVLNETKRDTNGVFVAEQWTNNKRKVSLFQKVFSNGTTLASQTALSSGESSRVSRSFPSPTLLSRQSLAPTQPKTAQRLHMSKLQTSQAAHSIKSQSKSIPSACPTAETPRTSQTVKTQSSKSSCSSTVKKTIAQKSPQLLSQTEILKFSCSPFTRSPVPKDHLSPSRFTSFSLRSTFTVSPSSSTESALLPKVYHSSPLQKNSKLSLLPEKLQSSDLFPDKFSSPKLSQSPPSNLEFLKQSQHFLCDPELLQLPQYSSQNPQTKSLEPNLSQTNPVPFRDPVKTLSSSSLFNESPPAACSRYMSTPANWDAPVFMSSSPICGDHESALSGHDTECIPSLSSHPLYVTQNPSLAVKMEEEDELLTDSEDEMSSDSLGLAPHEESSSDEEAQLHRLLTRGRAREEEQGNSAISHLQDSFCPTDVEREKDLQTDEQEQLSEPVMHSQSARSGSEQFCELDGFSSLDLDLISVCSDALEHTRCDPLCQTLPQDSGPTGSSWSGKSTPTLSHPPRTTPSPFPAPVYPTLSYCPSPPFSACVSPPTLGSELGPTFPPLSRAVQEIMEICSVDQMGCEDPDLYNDTTAHTLHSLEQELRLMTKGSGTHASVFDTGNSGNQDQYENQRLTRDKVSKEQKQEEEEAWRDWQSVLALP